MATTVREWKKKGQTGNLELELPSGNMALVRRLRPEAFLTSGLIPDALSDMVHKAIKSKKGLPPEATKEIAKDPEKVVQALQMMDEVLCYVVMEPPVEMPPRCGIEMAGGRRCGEYVDTKDNRHTDPNSPDYHIFMEDARDEDVLYADEVDLNDKSFIFQFALGGTADLERFREALSSDVADLSDSEAVPSKAKRTPRRK
jgi:hypothetical protein